jgi:uncharacterized protein (TIGR02266 family)
MVILLVDPSKPARELEKAALARFGFPVVAVAPDCLDDALRQVRPRLVLVAERGVDAASICQAVRRLPGPEAVPILLLTDDDGSEADARARRAGADAALARPLTRLRLARRLRPWLGAGAPHEARDCARVPVRVPLLYGLSATDLTGYLYNLSRTGLYVMTDRTFPPGTMLKLRLQLPNSRREFTGTARVVWVNRPDDAGAPAPARPPGMGVEFVELPPDTRNLVHLLVARLCGHGYATN